MKKRVIKSMMLSLPIVAMSALTSCGGGEPLSDTPTGDAPVATEAAEAAIFDVKDVLEIVAKENDIARKLYTKGIVGPGKKNGIKFDEDWRKDDVEAGPLPALFLRGISSSIQKSGVPLGLYLGSDFPINKANLLKGKQAETFATIKETEKPEFFYDEENELHTAMFPDFAAAMPCVTCHNDHEQTSKSDWELGDVMGATTWTYPKEKLTFTEAKDIVQAYRDGIVNTLGEYVEEIDGFTESEKPVVGEKWPTEGVFIPSPDAFLDSVKILASTGTLDALLANLDKEEANAVAAK